MKKILFYPIGTSDACHCSCDFLLNNGVPMIDHPSPEVTHILMDVPSFKADGILRNGQSLRSLLQMLPSGITLIGGNLPSPALDGYVTVDLLQDDEYLASNAGITADCAVKIAVPLLKTAFADSDSLIIGWGRIGKCLGKLLKGMGIPVTIAARKPSDRAMIHALGFDAVDICDIPTKLSSCRLLFNTVPAPVLSEKQLLRHTDCIKIDLASKQGITGGDVMIARGLPGIYAPISSGRLITETILRRCKEDFE